MKRSSSAMALVVVCALVLASCSSDRKASTPMSHAPKTHDGLVPSGKAQGGVPGPGWTPKPGMPLADPVQVRSEGGVLSASLDAQARWIYVSGTLLKVRNFNGQLIGPTMHVHPGDRIEVTLTNGMAENTNIHYHGFHVSPGDLGDNVFRAFKSGGTARSVFTLPPTHEVGLFWYHVHFHGISEGQVGGGLSGMLIVDGIEDRLPGSLRGITQRQLAIRDVRVPKNGLGVVVDQTKYNQDDTTTRLVNGQFEPTFSIRQGETQLWRIANIGSDLFYDLHLPGHTFAIIAEDGNLAWEVEQADHLPLPPGKRYDVLVQGGAPGSYEFGTNAVPTAPTPNDAATLAKVTVTEGDGKPPEPLPTTIETPEEKARHDLSTVKPDGTNRTFTFSFTEKGVPFQALINGKTFDINRLDVAARLGSTEDWTLINASEDPHPFHIHINNFQVIKADGKDFTAHRLQDVVTLPAGIDCSAQDKADGKTCKPTTVVIRQRYDDFRGWFVFHCHILGHEDVGMMQTIQVLGPDDVEGPPPHDDAFHPA